MADRGEFDVPELTEISWRNYLNGFFEEFYPILEKHGVSRDAALMLFALNRVDNNIEELKSLLTEFLERA